MAAALVLVSLLLLVRGLGRLLCPAELERLAGHVPLSPRVCGELLRVALLLGLDIACGGHGEHANGGGGSVCGGGLSGTVRVRRAL